MRWSQDGSGEKNQLLTNGVCHFWSLVVLVFYRLYRVASVVLWMFRTERGSFTLLLWCSVIEEANWLTLPEDIQKPGDGFDAVICLGNSFAHLPDFKGMFEIKWQIHFCLLLQPFLSKIENLIQTAMYAIDSVISLHCLKTTKICPWGDSPNIFTNTKSPVQQRLWYNHWPFCWSCSIMSYWFHFSQGIRVTKSWLFRTSPVWWDLVGSSSLTTVIMTTSWRLAGHHKAKISTIRYQTWWSFKPDGVHCNVDGSFCTIQLRIKVCRKLIVSADSSCNKLDSCCNKFSISLFIYQMRHG